MLLKHTIKLLLESIRLSTAAAASLNPSRLEGFEALVHDVVVLDEFGGDVEQDDGDTGNQTGGQGILGQQVVQDRAEETSEHIIVISGLVEVVDAEFEKTVSVDSEEPTNEGCDEGVGKSGSYQNVSVSAGISLHHAVGGIEDTMEVSISSSGGESCMELNEEGGKEHKEEVHIEVLPGVTWELTQEQWEQEAVGTEGTQQGQSTEVNPVDNWCSFAGFPLIPELTNNLAQEEE